MSHPLLILAAILSIALLVLLVRFFLTVGKKRQLMDHAKHIYVASLAFLGKSEEEDVAILVARNGFFSGVVQEKKVHHHFLKSLRLHMDMLSDDIMASFQFFEQLK